MIQIYPTFNHQHHHLLLTHYHTVLHTFKILHHHPFNLAILTTKIPDTLLIPLNLTAFHPFFHLILTLHHLQNVNPHPQ
ncbi:HAD hydrolase-like protein, partial [Bacillus altitudinis]|uniref:HAD hydrolase-like protein n=1 Tax=Bacillus altitudinis TaxID=293387 RepID=UPI003B526915